MSLSQSEDSDKVVPCLKGHGERHWRTNNLKSSEIIHDLVALWYQFVMECGEAYDPELEVYLMLDTNTVNKLYFDDKNAVTPADYISLICPTLMIEVGEHEGLMMLGAGSDGETYISAMDV